MKNNPIYNRARRYITLKGTQMLLVLLLSILLTSPSIAQNTQLFQVKTFDEQLGPYTNIVISINEKEIAIDEKGIAFVELSNSDLPVRTIQVQDQSLEAASWNVSKGILEVIIRKRNYHIAKVIIRDSTKQGLGFLTITFKGNKTITATTDASGRVELPLALNEEISSKDQFTIKGYNILNLQVSKSESILQVDLIKPEAAVEPVVAVEKAPPPTQEAPQITEDYFKDFNLDKLDSIQSLTVFYAVFKNYQIKEMDEGLKRQIDAKFEKLVGKLQDSGQRNAVSYMKNISDSTYVQDDIKNLLAQATRESQLLIDQEKEFENKIKIINDKLEAGFENMNDNDRASVLADINLLELILRENENRFYKNQNSFRDIINNLKERFFNLEDLENKLSASEMQRLEEQRVFRQRLLAILGVVALFAVLIILLIYFSNKLRKQKKALVKANNEVKRINENLEDIVYERTKLLEETYKELDTVLYRASHDLRSPVCSIVGLINIASTVSNAESAELLDRMIHTMTGMDKLLKKLSIISEINQPGNLSSIVLADMVEVIRKDFDDMIQEHQINFVIDCPKDIVIYSIPNLIEVILTNLIENALFYSMVKDSKDYKVVFSASVNDHHLSLSLLDNGIGVENNISDKLFDMFFRGTEFSKGNGLGLYIVQKSVHALNGKISVESEPGKFSKFVVHLPLQNATDQTLDDAPDAGKWMKSSARLSQKS